MSLCSTNYNWEPSHYTSGEVHTLEPIGCIRNHRPGKKRKKGVNLRFFTEKHRKPKKHWHVTTPLIRSGQQQVRAAQEALVPVPNETTCPPKLTSPHNAVLGGQLIDERSVHPLRAASRAAQEAMVTVPKKPPVHRNPLVQQMQWW